MADRFDSGLEAAPQNFPEVAPVPQDHGPEHYQQPQHYQHYQQPQQPYYPQTYDPSAAAAAKLEPPAPPSTYDGQTVASPLSAHTQTATTSPKSTGDRTVFGCSLLVFILSCIIAFLSAAVIGLAAATGVEAQRANSASSSLAALSASVASATGTSAPGATATAAAVLDDGCSSDPDSVNKTVYTSFGLLGGLKFTRFCNRDAPNPPLLSLFTANFGTCMDACAAYTKYVPGSFPGNSSSDGDTTPAANTTCEAVSFIPAWTSKVTANQGGAPGNCYLKGGPQNETGLTTPNIGVDVHAAVLSSTL